MPDNATNTTTIFAGMSLQRYYQRGAGPTRGPFLSVSCGRVTPRRMRLGYLYGAGCGTAGVIYFYFPRSPGAPAPKLLLFEARDHFT
jgi:hypothetical protein